MPSPSNAIDRRSTPPLSPSSSPDSSATSSSSSSSLSLPLHNDHHCDHPSPPTSQSDEQFGPPAKLGLMTDQLDEDAVMLDDWEEDERERSDGYNEGRDISGRMAIISRREGRPSSTGGASGDGFYVHGPRVVGMCEGSCLELPRWHDHGRGLGEHAGCRCRGGDAGVAGTA
ncbi:hypothetical protein BC834DRAFT_113200 [Gloeopeniophorella convolvens]|nr:hypothetical protein BC834DRAFT_113200 [Gloeopeniophorella convolvens]